MFYSFQKKLLLLLKYRNVKSNQIGLIDSFCLDFHKLLTAVKYPNKSYPCDPKGPPSSKLTIEEIEINKIGACLFMTKGGDF